MIFRFPMLLAQLDANAKQPVPEPGQVLGGMLVLSVMACSVVVIVLWCKRLQRGEPIFPAAMRKPLNVSLPLMIGGVVLASMMAWAAVDHSIRTMNRMQPAEPVAEEAAEDVDAAEASALSEEKLIGGMLNSLAVQLTIFLLIGTPLLLSQQRYSRAVVGRVTPSTVLPPDDIAIVDASNPYAAPQFDVTQDRTDLHVPPNPFIDAPDSQLLTEPEPWRFTTELRFAVETCLAAYVPMALIRLGILALQPEAPSHPFIEMMDDGVSFRMLALIAVLAIVVAPIVEELLYRVAILGGFMKQRSLVAGMIVSSVLFGFAHGFPDSLSLLPLAFALGYAYMQRRSYRTVVLVHLIFNAFNLAVAGMSML